MFDVDRYEHPAVFVTSRRTGETYKFLVRDDGTLVYGGTTFEQCEAWQAALAHLARISRAHAP